MGGGKGGTGGGDDLVKQYMSSLNNGFETRNASSDSMVNSNPSPKLS
jgi:hypothetical protein